MFSRMENASKTALLVFCEEFIGHGGKLIDCQVLKMCIRDSGYAHIRILFFFFLECFRKTPGDCQSKTSIFSTRCQIFIIYPGWFSFFRLIIVPPTVEIVIFLAGKIANSSAASIAHIVNKIAALFFYDNKFPTIPAQCMPIIRCV